MQRSTMSCNSVFSVGVSSLPTFVGSVAAPHFPWYTVMTVKTVVTRAILTVKTEVEAVMARLAFATPSACDL